MKINFAPFPLTSHATRLMQLYSFFDFCFNSMPLNLSRRKYCQTYTNSVVTFSSRPLNLSQNHVSCKQKTLSDLDVYGLHFLTKDNSQSKLYFQAKTLL